MRLDGSYCVMYKNGNINIAQGLDVCDEMSFFLPCGVHVVLAIALGFAATPCIPPHVCVNIVGKQLPYIPRFPDFSICVIRYVGENICRGRYSFDRSLYSTLSSGKAYRHSRFDCLVIP